MESGNFHTPSDEVVTRGASAGRGNSTLDFLYLSDGWLCRSSENRVNDFNVLEVYHAIRGNLDISCGQRQRCATRYTPDAEDVNAVSCLVIASVGVTGYDCIERYAPAGTVLSAGAASWPPL